MTTTGETSARAAPRVARPQAAGPMTVGRESDGAKRAAGQAPDAGQSARGAARRAAGARRAELAAFLRERRGRITPEAVGLPPGLRRRTPGLRREEVAQLAGVGVTWYTWLEQGRPINVSEQVLTAIARTLRLDPAEQAYLYRLAGMPPPTQRFDETLEPEIQTVLDALVGLPAAVCSPRFDLLRWNAAFAALYPGATLGSRNNLIWGAFTLQGCCTPYVHREKDLANQVAVLRNGYARHVGEPAWEMFIEDLIETSPQFAVMWARHEVASPSTRTREFRHPAVGLLTLTATYLTIPSTPETWITIYTPADDASRAALDWLVEHPEQATPDHTH